MKKVFIAFVTFILSFILQIFSVSVMAGEIKLSPDIVKLSSRELKALGLVNKWVGNGVTPYISGGKLVYVYGTGGIPTVIASPMQVCDVELQPGEEINEIVVGDSARWIVAEGFAGNSSHIFIKPVDSGLNSSAVITTDRRVYHLRLLSRKKEHIPYIGFVYPADFQADIAAKNARAAKEKRWNTTEIEQEQVDLSSLNFDYIVKGNASWKPERVYDNGNKTYIRFPKSVKSSELPALLVKKGKTDVLVNYRIKGLAMEVDGLFDTIVLVLGVDKQREEVEISRKNVHGKRHSRTRRAFEINK